MKVDEFKITWRDLQTERGRLAEQRNLLETELAEIRKKISHLDVALNHIAPLAGYAFDDDDIAGLGITDAIRLVLEKSGEKMSASDVRDDLNKRGYDLSELTAPMSSIYTILRRLADADEIDRHKDDGRVLYQWRKSEITDDDIPF